jgi:23S rRNA (cytidine2498-2'-O)-methyltransferase
MLLRCQTGFENWLVEELKTLPLAVTAKGPGWARTDLPEVSAGILDGLCFPHAVMLATAEVSGESVNALAEKIGTFFLESARTERFEGPWPMQVETAGEQEGLGRRADAVLRAVEEFLKKRMSRVAKLASEERPRGAGAVRGLFVYFLDFQHAVVSRRCFFGGQQRMADDPLAQSRSYLKLEEAYGLLNREPQPGERVADLGAAPGGWSYSAAKRGAQVVAVDNGPLKGGALDHPLIEHRREDAFRFTPVGGEIFDWMLCDLVDEPHHVMRDLMEPWLMRGWCRRFVTILKFGRVDPVKLLQELHAPDGLLQRQAERVRIRHLFHDREEFTLVGEVRLERRSAFSSAAPS